MKSFPYQYFKISGNVNEVIRAVLNSLFVFLRKDFARTKSTKSTKTQPSKSTKRCKQTKIKDAFKKHLMGGNRLFTYLHLFYARGEKRIEKRKLKKEKSPHNVDVLNTDVPTTRLI